MKRGETAAMILLRGVVAMVRRIGARGMAWLAALAGILGGVCGAEGEAPSFSIGPYLQGVTESTIIICWESDIASDGTIEYWVEGSHRSSLISVESDDRHEVRLENLEAGTAYGYRIRIPSEGEGSFFRGGFRTAPAGDAAFSFVIYGDTRGERPEHGDVVAAIRAVNPAFVVHTGDLVSWGDADSCWESFWGTVAPAEGEESLAGNSPIYPLIGNHEYLSAWGEYRNDAILNYQHYFVLPTNGLEAEHPEWSERFYSFRYGPVSFIILDVNKDSDPEYSLLSTFTDQVPPDIHPGSAQYEWLVGQLQAARAECPFTFVCFHPSPYSSGTWGRTSSYKMRFLDPLFRQYGVDAVFGAHDHFYERCETRVDDYPVLYFVEGAGGAPLYRRVTGWDTTGSWMWDEVNQTFYTKAFDNSSHSFLKVDVEPLGDGAWRAVFSAIRTDGKVIDVAQIERPWGHFGLGDRFRFSFEVEPGRMYQMEYCDDLSGGEAAWHPLGAAIVADGPFIRISDDGTETGTSPADDTVTLRFYRACELP